MNCPICSSELRFSQEANRRYCPNVRCPVSGNHKLKIVGSDEFLRFHREKTEAIQ